MTGNHIRMNENINLEGSLVHKFYDIEHAVDGMVTAQASHLLHNLIKDVDEP